LSSIKTGLHVAPIVGTGTDAGALRWHGHWAHEDDTRTYAQRLAECPAIAHATLTLHGDLGAGKTTFVRHLLRALGVSGRIKSPTYAVVEPHSSTNCALMPEGEVLHIWHFDFYRFSDPREWEDAGFRELFASPGLKLVEWPERAADTLTSVDADIHIEPEPMSPDTRADDADAARRVTFTAFTPVGRHLLAALQA
jgi:tRNA threonylcarbamoyladenosine biosynthesis protein TsaE